MKRRAIRALVALLALAGLAAVVRHDLAMLAWRKGDNLLRAGDFRGAAAAYRRADGVSPSLPVLFKEGVALYRLGEFRQAASRFTAASAAAEPRLRAAARYNMGNCAFRQGERLAATDQQGARRFFREASAEYEQVLAIPPGAADARQNLAVVRARLAGAAGMEGEDPRKRPQASDADRTGNGATGKGKGEERQHSGDQSAGRERESGKEGANRSRSGKPDTPAHGKKSAPKLTRDEAEQLLNEARGREAVSTAFPVRGIGRAARPEKDW